VLDEIGIDLNSTMMAAPGRAAAEPVRQVSSQLAHLQRLQQAQ